MSYKEVELGKINHLQANENQLLCCENVNKNPGHASDHPSNLEVISWDKMKSIKQHTECNKRFLPADFTVWFSSLFPDQQPQEVFYYCIWLFVADIHCAYVMHALMLQLANSGAFILL